MLSGEKLSILASSHKMNFTKLPFSEFPQGFVVIYELAIWLSLSLVFKFHAVIFDVVDKFLHELFVENVTESQCFVVFQVSKLEYEFCQFGGVVN